MAKGLNHYSLNQMYEMEYKELVQAIETTLFDAWDSKESYEYLLSNGEGHSCIHSGKSEEELARRLINTKSISGASCFETPEDAQDKIVCALLEKKNEIAKWLQKDWRETSAEDYRRMSFSVDMRNSDPAGYGFDEHFREKTTGAVRIVLERDKPLSHAFSKGCPCGFYIVTAYPDLNHPSAQFTGRQFSAEELANDISGSENPLKKTETYFRERGPERGLETFVRFVPADDAHPDSLKIKTRCDNYDICGYMACGKMHMKLIQDNKATKLNEFELATRYPKVAQYLAQIRNVYRKFSRGEKLEVSSPLKDQPKKAFEYDK